MIDRLFSTSHCSYKIDNLKDSLELHLVNLDQLPDQSEQLDATDQRRAEKLKTVKLQQRFINSRGYMRYCLGRYLDKPPKQLTVCIAEYGKPYLADHPIYFNISHSQNVALMAFTRAGACGVDIEIPRNIKQIEGIAERVFSRSELHYLNITTNESEKQQRFYQLWTRKEAYIKMTGTGLFNAINTVSVTAEDGRPLIISDGKPEHQLFDIKNSHAPAALCSYGTINHIRLYS